MVQRSENDPKFKSREGIKRKSDGHGMKFQGLCQLSPDPDFFTPSASEESRTEQNRAKKERERERERERENKNVIPLVGLGDKGWVGKERGVCPPSYTETQIKAWLPSLVGGRTYACNFWRQEKVRYFSLTAKVYNICAILKAKHCTSTTFH